MTIEAEITEIPLAFDEDKAEWAKALRQIRARAETAKELAQYRRALYLAHVEAGFTEAQALDLCRF